MRIGVLAWDSKVDKAVHGAATDEYPNIAVAAIVDNIRRAGHEVMFPWDQKTPVAKLYVSIIFAWNKPKIERKLPLWRKLAGEVILGGTGWDYKVTLPEDVEAPCPGYVQRAYPNFSANLGFTFRGCSGLCPWCVVWRKEGIKERRVARISDLVQSESRHLVLMNNNWLVNGGVGFLEDAQEIRSLGLTVDANQGMNILHVTPEIAQELAKLDFRNFSGRSVIRFAFDALAKEQRDPETHKVVGTYDMAKIIPEKVRLLQDCGIAPGRLFWYLLVGFEENMEQTMERWELLRSLGCQEGVYAQRFRDLQGIPDIDGAGHLQEQWVKPFVKWINGHLWRKKPFDEMWQYLRTKDLAPVYRIKRGGQTALRL